MDVTKQMWEMSISLGGSLNTANSALDSGAGTYEAWAANVPPGLAMYGVGGSVEHLRGRPGPALGHGVAPFRDERPLVPRVLHGTPSRSPSPRP